MKKKYSKILFLCLLLTVIIAGCSDGESRASEPGSDESEQVIEKNNNNNEEEIVASNGFVYERGERNIELGNTEDFNNILETEEKVLTVFYATWCSYCQELDTRLPEILDEFDDLLILNVDIEKHPDLANTFQAVATPTVVFFHQGKDPKGFRGALPTDMIIEFINDVSGS